MSSRRGTHFEEESVNSIHDTDVQNRVELRKECQTEEENLELRANTSLQETSNVEREQLRRYLSTAVEKRAELNEILHSLEAAVECLWVCMKNSIMKLIKRNVGDDSSSESESDKCEEGDVTECASRYSFTGRELAESRWNPCYESVETEEERSEEVGASSRLPDAAATCGNYETTICEKGTTSFTLVPSAASRGDNKNGGQSEKCPICLCEFDTQEIGTPECCDHSFCVDCLQEWSENSSICPLDREVYDAILVRRHLGGDVVGRIRVKSPRQQVEVEETDYIERCEVCRHIGFPYELIFCVRCGQGFHLQCVYPPLDDFPLSTEEWFCSNCSLQSLFNVD
jgi:hypothetical protein